MGKAELRVERSRKRERLTALLLALFPLLVATGFFAPGFVRLFATAQSEDPGVRGVVVDRVGPYGHRPLLVPRDFSAGYVPELLDLERLFVIGDSHLDPRGDLVARVSAFDRSYGDSIVRDSVAQRILDIVFKDALMDQGVKNDLLVGLGDDPSVNLGLCALINTSNCVRDDGLTNISIAVTVPIPEPSTALLLTFGIVGLGIAGRRL